MEERTVTRTVDVRSWPERADVLVFDEERAETLMIFPLQDNRRAPAWDPFAPYDERVADVILRLEADQDILRTYYELSPDESVTFINSGLRRGRIEELLSRYGFSLESVEMPKLMEVARKLRYELDVDTLYAFLCDWYDVVETGLPEGTAALRPGSWVHRAAPEKRCLYHYLITGSEDRSQFDNATTSEAYSEFKSLVDVPLENFSLGHLIRWIYFHRTEFDGAVGLPIMEAVSELQQLRRSK